MARVCGGIPKVYKITFPNGKVYIGITNQELKIRQQEHYSRARKGMTYKIHRALTKYRGLENWTVLRICSTYERAKLWEKAYIRKFNSKINGYNSTDGGDGNVGLQITENTRQKLIDSHTGKRQSKETVEKRINKIKGMIHKDARTIISTSLDGQDVRVYKGLGEIKKEGRFHPACVNRCCLGKRATHKGFTFKYEVR